MAFPLTNLAATVQFALQQAIICAEQGHAVKVLLFVESGSYPWLFRKCASQVERVLV